MTDLVARIVTSLRHQHDQLTAAVAQLTEDELAGPSGAAAWSVADTLSHLGSGAEITRGWIAASVDEGVERPDNQAIWDRWDALSQRDQANDFVEQDQALVELLEGLPADDRHAMRIDVDFRPEPVPLEVAAGMRLNEVAAHTWDVAVGLDAAAALDPEAADLLLDLYAGPLAFVLGLAAKPDELEQPAEVRVGDRAIVVGDAVSIAPAGAPTATFTGSHEAAVRLIVGRLGPDHTPADVDVTGDVSLDDLRRVFPGY